MMGAILCHLMVNDTVYVEKPDLVELDCESRRQLGHDEENIVEDEQMRYQTWRNWQSKA